MPGTLNNLEFDAAGNIVIASYGSTMAKISPAGNILWYLSGIENGIKILIWIHSEIFSFCRTVRLA